MEPLNPGMHASLSTRNLQLKPFKDPRYRFANIAGNGLGHDAC